MHGDALLLIGMGVVILALAVIVLVVRDFGPTLAAIPNSEAPA